MNVPQYSYNPPVVRIAFIVVAIVSLLCTQIPLLNYLGFEFSALLALVSSFLAGLLTISLWKQYSTVRLASAQSEIPPADETLFNFLKRLMVYLALLSILPLAIMSANALFVKNCSLTQGLLFYGLLVVPGVLFSSMASLVVGVSFDRWEKIWFALFFLFVLLHIPYVTVTGPQIFAFNPVVGFFPGITYDETMQVESRLALYRWATMAAAVVLFTIAVIIHRARSRHRLQYEDGAPVRTKIVHPAELITALLLLLALAGVMTFSEELGFSSSKSFIESQLGGKIETQHFVIFYPAQTVGEAQAKQLGLLHEFYFATLARELRVVSVKKIHSFLYATPAQKGTLVGAARTNIAKPWLWQIHLNLNDLEASLKHELVHVMAAEFGFPLFRVGLNSGLIEGLATAVERVQGDETLHRAAAQIFSVNIQTDMKSLFSLSGFARAHPGVGYSLAGSFCRFLIDRYGMRRFKRLYRSGDFRLVYSKEIDILLSEWRRHVEQYRVDDAERQKAAYLYKRPTIFGKECARVLANLNAETRRRLEQGQYQLAFASASRSLRLSSTTEAIMQQMNALLRLGRAQEAVDVAEQYFGDSTLAHALLPMKLQLGEAFWAMDDHHKAKKMFNELHATHLSRSTDEACLLRLEALADTALSKKIQPYFIGTLSDSARVSLLHSLIRAGQRKELLAYLLARDYALKGEERRAIQLLLPIERMKPDFLEFQRQLRLARLQYTVGEFQRAKIHFWQSLNYTSSDALRFRIQEWLDRCDWMTNPPAGMFEEKKDELESKWEGKDSCDCQAVHASFMPANPN